MEASDGTEGRGMVPRRRLLGVPPTTPIGTPPLPGEEEDAFAQADRSRRWVLFEHGLPIGRVAAFLPPAAHPGVGYFGFFECPDDPVAATGIAPVREGWLAERGCHECYGPIAGTPRDRIGLLIERIQPAGDDLHAVQSQPWYRILLESAGYTAEVLLRAYGW